MRLFIIILFSWSSLFAQNEDFNWIFSATSADSLDNLPLPGLRPIAGASVLNFNQLPPNFYRTEQITLDFNKTNLTYTHPISNQLHIYSNGQSIFGHNHEVLINGGRINDTPKWDNLSWSNENGEQRPTGFK